METEDRRRRLKKTRTFASPAAGVGRRTLKYCRSQDSPTLPGRIQTTMRARGCGRPGAALCCSRQLPGRRRSQRAQGGETPGNFMEDEQWLSSISQYSGKIKHWNRFRDVSLHRAGGRGSAMGFREGASGKILGPGVAAARQPRAPQPSRIIALRVNGTHPPGSEPLPYIPLSPRAVTRSPDPTHTCPERGSCSGGRALAISSSLQAGCGEGARCHAEGRGRRQGGRTGPWLWLGP